MLHVLGFLVGCLALLGKVQAGPIEGNAPYPASEVVTGISFDWSTAKRTALSSDNWPLTWSADGHQYTSFGDGGGFGGTNLKGRVSLGFARITGAPTDWRGANLWGGVNAEARASFLGKAYGILALDSTLYMWRCGDGSNVAAFRFQQLYRSTNNARSWTPASWKIPGSVTLYCPSFIQAGQGYAAARDGYVYAYAAERNSGEWTVHQPGRIALLRVPKASIMVQKAYEYFAGLDAAGQPTWTTNIAARRSVFNDPNGVRLVSGTFVPGLGRYLLVTEHAPKNSGSLGIFDAENPWGPWTTVTYQDGWGPPGQVPSAFFWNFAPAWFGPDGTQFTLVWTGTKAHDAWNSARGSFTVAR